MKSDPLLGSPVLEELWSLYPDFGTLLWHQPNYYSYCEEREGQDLPDVASRLDCALVHNRRHLAKVPWACWEVAASLAGETLEKPRTYPKLCLHSGDEQAQAEQAPDDSPPTEGAEITWTGASWGVYGELIWYKTGRLVGGICQEDDYDIDRPFNWCSFLNGSRGHRFQGAGFDPGFVEWFSLLWDETYTLAEARAVAGEIHGYHGE